MKGKTYLILFGVVIAVALGGVLLMGGNSKAPDSTQGTSQEVLETPSSESLEASPAADVKEIVVEGDEYSFSPKVVTLFKGEKVRLIFKNTGSLPHNYMAKDLNIATKTIPGGSSESVEFTPEEVGTFAVYCGVGGHRDLGMEGSIVVE